MVAIPLGLSDWRRDVAQEARVRLRNRYFEKTPTNPVDQVSLLARPGLKRWLEVGNGPIRAVYSQPGSFDDALFVVSESSLYRIDQDETVTLIGTGVFGNGLRASVSMAATANIGSTPAMLYVADGKILWLYVEDGFASGTLTSTGAIATTYTIRIDAIYYRWTSGAVNTGTPDGTAGNPWLVALGASNTEAFANMYRAINADGTPGVTYSTALTAHPTAAATSSTATQLNVRAINSGTGGNSLVTTVISGANIAWGGGTLSGGGAASFAQVAVPDDAGAISVGYIAGFVIVVIAQGYDVNGRFYWIEPGETSIDPLNFATAERSPDPLLSVRVVGDQFWLFGTATTEVWYVTGVEGAPMARIQGRLFDHGIWEGTDVQINDNVFVVDADGIVYVVGSEPQRISNEGIEERIRVAMRLQTLSV